MPEQPEKRLTDAPGQVPAESPSLPTSPAPTPSGGEATPLPDQPLHPLAGAWWQGHIYCPHCSELVENLLVPATLLGPSLLRCPRCNRVLPSHRREWGEMSPAGRLWFVALSLLDALACAAIAFVGTALACGVAHVPVLWPATWAALAWGVAVLGLQAFRVVCSVLCGLAVSRTPVRASFWSLDFYLPQKVLAALVLSAVGVGVGLWLTHAP